MLFLERQGFGDKFILDPNESIIRIGRNPTNQIKFSSAYVSRQHCEILRIPPHGTLLIKNCTETNSTNVDGAVLKGKDEIAELSVGALIGLGVPLDLCNGDYLNDDRFVFLKVCEKKQEVEIAAAAPEKEASPTLDKENIVPENQPCSIVRNEAPSQDLDIVILDYSDPHFENLKCAPLKPKQEVHLFSELSDDDGGSFYQAPPVPSTAPDLSSISSASDKLHKQYDSLVREQVVAASSRFAEKSSLQKEESHDSNPSTSKHAIHQLELRSIYNVKSKTSPFRDKLDEEENIDQNVNRLEEFEFQSCVSLENELENEVEFQSVTEKDLRPHYSMIKQESLVGQQSHILKTTDSYSCCQKEENTVESNTPAIKKEILNPKPCLECITDYSFITLSDSESELSDDEFVGAKNSRKLSVASDKNSKSSTSTEILKEVKGCFSNLMSSTTDKSLGEVPKSSCSDEACISNSNITVSGEGRTLAEKSSTPLDDQSRAESISKRKNESCSYSSQRKRIKQQYNKDSGTADKDDIASSAPELAHNSAAKGVEDDVEPVIASTSVIDNCHGAAALRKSVKSEMPPPNVKNLCKLKKCSVVLPKFQYEIMIKNNKDDITIKNHKDINQKHGSQSKSIGEKSDFTCSSSDKSLFLTQSRSKRFKKKNKKTPKYIDSSDSDSESFRDLVNKRKKKVKLKICSSESDSDIGTLINSATNSSNSKGKALKKCDKTASKGSIVKKLGTDESNIYNSSEKILTSKSSISKNLNKPNKPVLDEQSISENLEKPSEGNFSKNIEKRVTSEGDSIFKGTETLLTVESNISKNLEKPVISKGISKTFVTSEDNIYSHLEKDAKEGSVSKTVVKSETHEDIFESFKKAEASGNILPESKKNYLFGLATLKKEPKEQLEDSDPINDQFEMNIKIEPGLKKSLSDDESENDEIFGCYSQIDDVILISSSDEELSEGDSTNFSLENASFGPLPPEGEFEESGKSVTDLIDLPNLSVEPEEERNTGLNINDQKETKDLEGSLQENNSVLQNAEEILEDEEWWPALSQGFFDSQAIPEEKLKGPITNSNRVNNRSPIKDLNSIIKKINNFKTAKCKFTEPQTPPPRTKGDTIRKRRGRKAKSSFDTSINALEATEPVPQESFTLPPKPEAEVTSKDSTPKVDSLSVEDHIEVRGEHFDKYISKPVMNHKNELKSKSPHKGKKINKRRGDIRNTLLKTHNFDMYKRHDDKKKHHLVNKSNEPSTSSSKSDRIPKHDENISVLSKSNAQTSGVFKCIAKNSRVSRIKKLMEIDLFGAVPAKEKPGKFKIPKKTNKEADAQLNQPTEGMPQPIKLTEGVLHPVNLEKRTVCDAAKQVAKTTVKSTQRKSNETTISHDKKIKGILKLVAKPASIERFNVKFPVKDTDLVSIRHIPIEKRGCVGPQVTGREKYIPAVHPFEFIYTMCNWNYDWLLTYRLMKSRGKPSPPSVCNSKALPTLTNYLSFQDYKDTFSTLMYYESWENVFKDWDKYIETNTWFTCYIDSNKPTFINFLKFNVLKVLCLVTYDWSIHRKHPTSGSLVVMKYKIGTKAGHTLGYVENISKRNAQCVPQQLRNNSPQNANIVLTLEIWFSKSQVADIKVGSTVLITNISYIRPSLKAFECLCKLPTSPLSPFILRPGDLAVLRCDKVIDEYLIHQMPMNETQRKAIVHVSSKCFHEPQTPKISIIHGPPGTGKTRLIVALVAQINQLFKESKFSSNRRILLCAPSNAAVDELVIRVAKLQELKICLNLVRVGVKENMNPAVKDFHFEAKVRKELEKLSLPQNKSLQLELEQKDKYAQQAVEEYEAARMEGRPEAEIIEKELRMVDLIRSKTEFANRCKSKLTVADSAKLDHECRKMVLMRAEVIITTLTSCLSGCIPEVFGRYPDSFACCIVDEAGQCKETETWFPLHLGIKKLILVGDHMQLPATILSYISQGKNLHQSLFERIYHHIGVERGNTEVLHNLTVQYRMHEEILAWPSKRFYHNSLTTAPGISNERRHSLSPLLVFNIVDSGEQRSNPRELYNMAEVMLIKSLIEALENYLRKLSIGIITPYLRQKAYLLEKLDTYVKKYKITVSTVDGFQGQEKDVIFCSFVRSNPQAQIGFVSDRHRLNVALTRARKSCFIVGDLSSLTSNEDWKDLYTDALRRNLVRTIYQTVIKDKQQLIQMALVGRPCSQ